MNEYDSEKMLAVLESDYSRVHSAEEADLVLVNTCSVRDKAEQKLYSLLGRLRDLKASRPDMRIGVGGCVAQQEGENIIQRSSAVDFVVGTQNLSLIPSLLEAVAHGLGPQVAVDYRDEWEDLPDDFDVFENKAAENAFGAFSSPVRAMVSIQRGCNKHCAFCVVPTTRGPEVSRDVSEILRETRIKVRRGAKEVLLLGQTVNSFGRDLSPRISFADLIKSLAEIEGLERIRFTSPHPADVRKDFVALYREVPALCPQIHLPLQSGSDRILKLMNRNYRIARYLDIVEELRATRPDIAISSDFIVGFPTESDRDFEATLEIIRKVQYDSSYSFKYSRRPNTSAINAYLQGEEVLETTKQRRLEELQALQSEISERKNKEKLGSFVELLVEGQNKNISSTMRGRTPQNTPTEIIGENVSVGSIIQAKVIHAGPHGLRAEAQEEL